MVDGSLVPEAQTVPTGAATAVAEDAGDRLTKAQRWTVLTGWLIGSSGTLSVVFGIAIWAGSPTSGVGPDQILTSDFHAPAWTVILLGVLQAIAASLIWLGQPSARWFGIVVSCVAIVGSALHWAAHPVWASLFIVLDVVVIYGLAVYDARGSLV